MARTCDYCDEPNDNLEWQSGEFWVEEEDPRTGKVHHGWKDLSGWFCPDDKEEQRFCWQEYLKSYGVECIP